MSLKFSGDCIKQFFGLFVFVFFCFVFQKLLLKKTSYVLVDLIQEIVLKVDLMFSNPASCTWLQGLADPKISVLKILKYCIVESALCLMCPCSSLV